jgi:hypothetical protein
MTRNDPRALDLEQAVALTQRAGVTTAASVAVAGAGGLLILSACQLGYSIRLSGPYQPVPYAMLGVGVVLVALGSRIYSQRVWAVLLAILLAGGSALGMGAWFLLSAGAGIFSLLVFIAPFGAVAAAMLAAMALGPCLRTRRVRRQAAAAGMDIDL